MKPIERLPESKEGVVLVDTQAVNTVIDALNALLLLKVTPDGVGKLLVSEKNAVLELGGLREYIYGLVQAAQNGGAGGGARGGGGTGGGTGGVPPGGGPGGGGLSPEMEQRLNNIQLEGKCNGDGTFTITGRI